MKFYLDEDLSPKIAEILRKNGIDAISVHESGMLEGSDQQQLEYAAQEKRCFLTRNRNDFIKLTIQFLNEHKPQWGVLIIPYTIQGDRFAQITRLIKDYASRHSSGLEPYVIDFLSTK